MTVPTQPLRPPSRLLLAMELRTLPELGSFVASWPLLAAMTPAVAARDGGRREERVALRLAGASLAEVVRLLHVLETATTPLPVARLELRKHPDDPGRFDATVEVARLAGSPP